MNYFSIHGIVGVFVGDEYPWFQTLLNDLPEDFICSKAKFDKCPELIEIRYNKKIANDSINGIEDSHFVDNEYGVRITLDKHKLIIECSQECNEWLMFALSYQLNKSGYCFVHAAAFEKDGNVVIIPSSGGTGKTIITINWVKERGYNLLGDDLCIIDKEGNILSYPKKMVLYPWHWEQIDGFSTDISLNTKKQINMNMPIAFKEHIKKVVRKSPSLLAILRKHNPSLKQYSPREVFKRDVVSQNGVLKQILFLERSNKKCSQTLDQIAAKMYLTTNHELFHYFYDKINYICREEDLIDPLCLHVIPFSIMQCNTHRVDTKVLSVPKDYSVTKFLEEVNKELLIW